MNRSEKRVRKCDKLVVADPKLSDLSHGQVEAGVRASWRTGTGFGRLKNSFPDGTLVGIRG